MNIVIAYDGSAEAKAALSVTKKHAIAFNSAVHVVTSLVGTTHNTAEEIRQYEDELVQAKRFFSESGIPAETHLLIRGLSPGEDIVRFACEIKADEIILGVRRRSAVEKLVFGSNARFIILNAGCPVVSVK